MNAVSEDIKDMLIDSSSLGLDFPTNLFIGHEQKSPDNCVTIYDTPSFSAEVTLDQQRIYRSSFQIRVRHLSYATGMTLARDIMDYLHDRAQESWNGTLYTTMEATGEPAQLALDGNMRAIIIINFTTKRR